MIDWSKPIMTLKEGFEADLLCRDYMYGGNVFNLVRVKIRSDGDNRHSIVVADNDGIVERYFGCQFQIINRPPETEEITKFVILSASGLVTRSEPFDSQDEAERYFADKQFAAGCMIATVTYQRPKPEPEKRVVWVNLWKDNGAFWHDSQTEANQSVVGATLKRIGNRAWPLEIPEE